MKKGKKEQKKANNNEWANLILKSFALDDTLEAQKVHLDDELDARELAEQLLKMKKLGTLKKEYPKEKVKFRPDGRCYVYINRKQYIAPTYEALLEKLYEEFYGTKNYTLSDIYPDWQIYRRDVVQVSSNTLKDHSGYWNNYMKDSDLVKIPISKIRPRDIKKFYQSVVTENDITEDTFKFFRTILNKLFDFAISELEIIQFNPIPSINTDIYKKCFKAGKSKKNDVYKKKDRDKLLNYLKDYDDDIYALGIQLAFRLIIRIGELKALRWTDIDDDFIDICHQTVERQVMNNDLTFEPRTTETISQMKGEAEEGHRQQYLTPEAKEILKKIRKLNPDGEYILMKDGKQLSTCTFNRHLQKFCEDAGVKYHSSHKIRFTSASLLYDGSNLALLSNLLGHTTTRMTVHYFRNVLGEDEVKKLMSKLDQVVFDIA